MTIVDLRGREREPEVLALLDPGPTWNVVGWERDDRLVACAGIERTSDDELAIRARLPSGLTLDLTREQFVNGERLGAPSPDEALLTHRNPERLAMLRARVRARPELD